MSAHGVVKKVYTPEQVDFIATIWKDQLLLIPVTGENKSKCISVKFILIMVLNLL